MTGKPNQKNGVSWFVSFMLLCLIPGLTVGICGDYLVKPVPVLPIESYPARVTIGAITVAANPYPSDEKSYTAFDIKNLNSQGYFPLQIIIQNSSPDYLTIKTRNIILIANGGQEFFTFPATLVVQEVVKGSLLNKIPKVGSKDPSTSMKTGSPLIDFTQKELTNRGIDPGTVASGFLFFYTPEKKKNVFLGAKLRIPAIFNESSRKAFGPFEIVLDPALAAAGDRK